MKCEFHPEAFEEYEEAVHFYASCRDGLDLRFIEAVESAIRHILNAPRRPRALEDGIRRCLTKVFPYAILYSIEPDCLLILAVMHCHRKPGYWRHRRPGSK